MGVLNTSWWLCHDITALYCAFLTLSNIATCQQRLEEVWRPAEARHLDQYAPRHVRVGINNQDTQGLFTHYVVTFKKYLDTSAFVIPYFTWCLV